MGCVKVVVSPVMETWAGVVRVSHMGERKAGSETFHADREQLDPIEAWAKKKGVALDVLDPELGVSGGLPLEQRPSLLRAVEGVESGQYAGIVVAYLSRLGRNVAEQLRVWDRVEAAEGEIVTIREGIETTTAAGRLQRNLLLSIDAHEREQHGERFEERRRLATEAGIWQRRQTPTGYRKGDDRRLTPGRRADDVRRAFADRRAAKEVAKIARDLGMTPSGARQLLRNRVYLGELRVGKHVNLDAHPAIIDPETFEAVQARRAVRPARSAPGGPALLAGLARCGSCGHVMTRRGAKGGGWAYGCPTNHSGERCPAPVFIVCHRLDPHVEAIALIELERLRAAAVPGDRAAEIRREITEERRDLDALLDRFKATDLGAALTHQAEKRGERIAELEEELRIELGRVKVPEELRASELWPDLNAHERNDLLRGLLAAVVVQPVGRGQKIPVADRAAVLRHGAAVPLPGRGGGNGAGIVPITIDPDSPDVLGVPAGQDLA
jgi:DNA invertase Pin-like site-specific DNA recombinase